MREIKAYRCDFCDKILITKAGMKNHEGRCRSNPKNNHCSNCVHGIIKQDKMGSEDPYCLHHEVFIFQKDKRDNAYFIGCDYNTYYDGSDSPVPYSCFYFESKGSHGFAYEEAEEDTMLRNENNIHTIPQGALL